MWIFYEGTVVYGELMLEQVCPEELQPMGRTHTEAGEAAMT